MRRCSKRQLTGAVQSTISSRDWDRFEREDPVVAARIFLSPPHMSEHERRFLDEAFDSNWIAPLGPQVDAFEAELSERVEGRHVAALSSGTAALHLAMEILGVGPGDEVLVSTLTFSASVNPIRYQGAMPVFVDSEFRSWNMDPGLLAEELDRRARAGKLPKAVVAVDLYGQCADYEPIVAACRKYDVPLVEDAAEALGGTYQGRRAYSGTSRSSRSTGTRSSRRAGEGRWSRTARSESRRRASWQLRPVTRHRTTSTPTSVTTTG